VTTDARILEYHLTTIRLAKQEGLDLSNYKHIIVIHAGKDEAFGGTANDIWSHCLCVAPEVLYFSDRDNLVLTRWRRS
jgi:hypothetical protein